MSVLKKNDKEVFLTLKKRPKHFNPFARKQEQRRKQNAVKKQTGFHRNLSKKKSRELTDTSLSASSSVSLQDVASGSCDQLSQK